ncbi:MAG: protein-glutamate O-methyltransferase CheR [Actinobacteria bacterium]|nr:protein-glutamate O-methyltransferase CheR [Actinomycetota bacterium]
MADIATDRFGLEAIIKRIEKYGFDCRQLRPSYLERRLLVRLRATKSKSYTEYRKLLDSEPAEYELLMDALTVNLTEFFRDAEVFKFFADAVVPELHDLIATSGHRLIRSWSAGCASGEEAYSIAMTLHQGTIHRKEKFNISVTGTDIDSRALERAKLGQYDRRYAGKVPERYQRRYFTDHGDYLKISPAIRSLVRFKRLDLFAEKPLRMVDVIFCRNVMIYFNRSQQEKLQKSLCDSLLNAGYLIFGRSEKLVGEAAGLMEPVNVFLRVYRKR